MSDLVKKLYEFPGECDCTLGPKAADLIVKLDKRIANLEGWNKEMYENHKIELTRLEGKIKNLKVHMANAGVDPE